MVNSRIFAQSEQHMSTSPMTMRIEKVNILCRIANQNKTAPLSPPTAITTGSHEHKQDTHNAGGDAHSAAVHCAVSDVVA